MQQIGVDSPNLFFCIYISVTNGRQCTVTFVHKPLLKSKSDAARRKSRRAYCGTIGSIGFERRARIDFAASRRRIFQIVAARMQRAASVVTDTVRFAINKKQKKQADVRVAIAGIGHAGGLVTDRGAVGRRALRRNAPFADGRAPTPNESHFVRFRPGFPPAILTRNPGKRSMGRNRLPGLAFS